MLPAAVKFASRSFAATSLLIAFALAGCRSVPPAPERLPSVTGTITLRSGENLPAGAVLEIRLVDFTRQEAPPALVVERSESNPGQPPVHFRLPYNPAVIDPQRDYAIETRIVAGGRPRWVQSHLVPVITKNRPVLVELVLQAAESVP